MRALVVNEWSKWVATKLCTLLSITSVSSVYLIARLLGLIIILLNINDVIIYFIYLTLISFKQYVKTNHSFCAPKQVLKRFIWLLIRISSHFVARLNKHSICNYNSVFNNFILNSWVKGTCYTNIKPLVFYVKALKSFIF